MMKNWQLLDQMRQNNEFEIQPQEFWVLDIFYIVLTDTQDGSKYIPFLFPAYRKRKEFSTVNGWWSPPVIANKVDLNLERPRTPKAVKQIYKEYISESKELFQKQIGRLFYDLGLQWYKIGLLKEFIEYKKSFSESTVYKCYYIRNWHVYDIDDNGLINVLDPFHLKGLSYFRLSETYDNMFFNNKENQLFYNGLPMATNVSYCILQGLVNNIENDNKVDIMNYITPHKNGYVFNYDINSSGYLRKIIEQEYKSFDKEGKEFAEDFLSFLSKTFVETLSFFNISEYSLEGDGFYASIPIEYFKVYGIEEISTVSLIADICNMITKKIDEKLKYLNINISGKVSVCKRDYRFGKVSGLLSSNNTYAGEALFYLARQQSGLSAWMRENNAKQMVFSFDEQIIIDDDLFQKAGHFSGDEKESKVCIDVYMRR